jgi:biopolymer transport protein ExbD
MGNASMMIRYIDIALTILFGFIAISDVEIKTQIKLPSSVATINKPAQMNTVSIIVLEGSRYTLMEADKPIIVETTLEKVENTLIEVRKRYLEKQQDVLVLIQPDPNSPIQLTVNILDICERNHIAKNINYVEPGV